MKKKAFTIVELVIVITIISILMTAGFIGGSKLTSRSRELSIQSQFGNFEDGIVTMLHDQPKMGRIETLGLEIENPEDPEYTGITVREEIVNELNTYLDKCAFEFGNDSSGNEVITSTVDDPYGTPYQLSISIQKVLDKNAEIRFYVKSAGKNKQTLTGKMDSDDVTLMIECVNNRVDVTTISDIDFGEEDNTATANDGSVVFMTSNVLTHTASLNGAHTAQE